MTRIFYDHQKFSTQLYGGISRYFANLIQDVEARPNFDYQLGVVASKNHYIKARISPDNFLFKQILNRQGAVYTMNKKYCEFLLQQNKFDVFHPTYYDTYFVKRLKKPLVITIHDMTYERFPEYFWAKDPLTYQKRINIEKADRIIAISQTTKNDLIKYTKVDPDKIKVVYHGMDLNMPWSTSPVKDLPAKYFLFVGDRSGYKNFYLFLNALKKVQENFPDIKVVLTGGGTLDIAEIEYLQMLGLTNQVMHTNVSDAELNYLYQHAMGFVYPSLHEGFGLPILEAFRAKCPIILSDTECFREIATDCAVFFDPNSINELAIAMESLITDQVLRQTVIDAGSVRLKDFPLETSLKETLDIYQEVI